MDTRFYIYRHTWMSVNGHMDESRSLMTEDFIHLHAKDSAQLPSHS